VVLDLVLIVHLYLLVIMAATVLRLALPLQVAGEELPEMTQLDI
jgi:hypothetical protein